MKFYVVSTRGSNKRKGNSYFSGSDTDAGDLYGSILDNMKKPICIIKPGQQFMFSQN